jgi:hypothetical protein
MQRRTTAPLIWFGCLAALLLMFVSVSSSAAGNEVPVALRAAIIMKATGYERGFAGRSGTAVVAVVLGSSDNAKADGAAVAAALESLFKKTKMGNRSGKVVRIEHVSQSETNSKLSEAKAELVYVADGLEGIASDIPAKDGSVRRIVACSDGSKVKGGCVLGVERSGEKSRLVVNLARANSVGLRFPPELLGLARVVR